MNALQAELVKKGLVSKRAVDRYNRELRAKEREVRKAEEARRKYDTLVRRKPVEEPDVASYRLEGAG